MITIMRRYRRALQVGLLVVIVAFVASLFIFGATGPGGGARDSVAIVNGAEIPVERYQRRYQEYLDTYAQILRERVSPETAERLGLARQVVDDLVQEELIAQRAQAEGLAVTDDELNAQIQAIPAFHEGGRFALRRYDEVVRRLGYTKSGFESEMRRRLTRGKVEQLVRAGVNVSETEVEQAWTQSREQVRVAWGLVEVAALTAAITPSDGELAAHLTAHAGDFRLPERRRVQYVAVDAKALRPPVSDAAVATYYREHGAEFEQPRRVRAAHILARVAETGGSEAEDRARAKVTEAIRRARAGEDFAKLARELSEDKNSAAQGGELGFVAKGEMVPAIEQALAALKPGAVAAEPVRTPLGYHALKALEVRPGGKKPLTEVAAQIRERLATEAAEGAARARAEEARAKLLGAGDFLAEARALGLAPVETTIARRPRAPGLPPDPLEEAAFELARGGVSAPVRTPGGFLVVKQIEALPASVPPLAEVRDRVAAAVKRQKAEAQALDKARQMLAEARSGDLGAAARTIGATFGETARFTRSKPPERLPGDAVLAALQTPTGGLTEPVRTPQGVFVLKVLERVAPAAAGPAAERDKLAADLLARKQGQAWEAWMRAARARATIEISGRFPASRG
jgi:peptidyl-prolyl cis-trans isomerase D